MNVGILLTKSARTFPKNLGIAYGLKKLTYAQFNFRTNRLANAIYKLGIKQVKISHCFSITILRCWNQYLPALRLGVVQFP